MKLFLSENIRRLRREADMTQDKLAEFLCVSPQTISKWERNETYPDIEMLPVIANFFDVTVDELMGNNKSKAEAEIERICRQSQEAGKIGNEEEVISISRSGYQRYPYSYKMMHRYASDLCLYSTRENWDTEKIEIRDIAQRILENCAEDHLRYAAMSLLFSVTDNKDELKTLCDRVPDGFDFTRELWLESVYTADTEEGIQLRQNNMLELLWWFLDSVASLCGYDRDAHGKADLNPAVKIDVCNMELSIYRCLFREGDYLQYAWNIAYSYYKMALAYLENGEPEPAVDSISKMADYTVAYWSLPEKVCHTSFLVNRLEFEMDQESARGSCGSPEYYLAQLQRPEYDPIRGDVRFRKTCERLRDCPEGNFKRLEKDFEWLRNI